MQNSDKHLQERLGAALVRLATIERRASAAPDSPRLATRLIDDVRKLTGELERAFSDVQAVLAQCARLQEEAASATARAEMLFSFAPVACVLTDMAGAILEANEPAVRLLNVSRRHLLGRSFHLYLSGEREGFLKRIQRLPDGSEPEQWSTKLRPRERSVVSSDVTAALDPEGRVLLMLQPISAAPAPGFSPLGAMPAASLDTASAGDGY